MKDDDKDDDNGTGDDDICIRVIGNSISDSDMASKDNGKDDDNGTGDVIDNEVRSGSRISTMSDTSVGSVTISEYEYLTIENNLIHEIQSDTDIAMQSDSDCSKYEPTQQELKWAEQELKEEISDEKKRKKKKK